jgi:hypothetical protein
LEDLRVAVHYLDLAPDLDLDSDPDLGLDSDLEDPEDPEDQGDQEENGLEAPKEEDQEDQEDLDLSSFNPHSVSKVKHNKYGFTFLIFIETYILNMDY